MKLILFFLRNLVLRFKLRKLRSETIPQGKSLVGGSDHALETHFRWDQKGLGANQETP